MPVYNTMQFVARNFPAGDSEGATAKLRDQLARAGFDPYEGTPGCVRGTSLLTPAGSVLWAVVEEVAAPDAGAALADLGARLTRAGFRLYANQQNLLFDGYQLAYLSENQPDLETEGKHVRSARTGGR
jgi:hypothetical protein